MTTLRDLCRQPGPRLGTYVAEFVTPGIGHLLRSAGCDFVLLGMEHNGLGVESVKSVLRFMEAADLPVIVHVPSHSPSGIARVCDVGAEGIMTPMTGSAAQARAALDAIKYPPLGKRGCGMPIAYERHAGDMAAQIAAANARTVYLPLIENVAGVENAEAIASLDGVDGLWVGQLDLSIALGIPDQLDHPDFIAAIERVAAAGRRHGKAMAILASSVEQGRHFFDLGYNMICLGEDSLLYRDALAAGLAELRDRIAAAAP